MTEIFWKSYVKIFYILKTHKDDEHGNAENKFFVLQKTEQSGQPLCFRKK